MKISKRIKGFAIGLAAVGFAVYSAQCQDTINQTGTSGTTYTGNDDGQGSANLLREINYVTVANDANNLYISLAITPGGNLATGGAFNYIIGITTGSPTAGGDTSANATTHGNAYSRSISFDSGFGGMTDFIGIFGAGGSGTGASPYTSYGFNDYVFGTPGSAEPAGVWTKINTVASGEPISDQPSTSNPNLITLTVPMADFASNLSFAPNTSIDFDVESTGTSGTQTAYGDLALSGPVQSGVSYYHNGTLVSAGGTYSATYQFNETILDQYTVPEPTTLALAGAGGLLVLLRRRK